MKFQVSWLMIHLYLHFCFFSAIFLIDKLNKILFFFIRFHQIGLLAQGAWQRAAGGQTADKLADEGHSTPLIDTSYDLTPKAARTLLERFRSKSYDFNTQFTHVSRHFGT